MLESLAKAQRISVIEQAIAPTDPESPNRLLIAIGGIVGGLAAGLGLVVLLEAAEHQDPPPRRSDRPARHHQPSAWCR